MKTAALGAEEKQFLEFLSEAHKEMMDIHRDNQKLNVTIKRLSASTRRNLVEIRKNLDYVKALR